MNISRNIKAVVADPVGGSRQVFWRAVRNGMRKVNHMGFPVPRNERLVALRKRFAGRRCFLIGNGPSINQMDLSPLADEVTFGVNGIFLKFDQWNFRPTFYTIEDENFAESRAEVVNDLRGMIRIFPLDLRFALRDVNDETTQTVFINFIRKDPEIDFSHDCSRRVYWGASVTYMSIQLAAYLGLDPIYLIGNDFNYDVPEESEGGTFTADGPSSNHFDPNYFVPGQKASMPRLNLLMDAFERARTELESKGKHIYNATVGGKLEVFERVNYQDLFRQTADRR